MKNIIRCFIEELHEVFKDFSYLFMYVLNPKNPKISKENHNKNKEQEPCFKEKIKHIPEKIELPCCERKENIPVKRNKKMNVVNQTHVTWNKEDRKWEVKKAGSDVVLASDRLKKEAVKLGREISKEEKSEFVIHNRDGKIAQKDSHGNDPRGNG